MSATLRPIRNGRRYFSTATLTGNGLCVNVAHPTPYRPGSLVSTLTITSRMPSGSVRMTLMSLIVTSLK